MLAVLRHSVGIAKVLTLPVVGSCHRLQAKGNFPTGISPKHDMFTNSPRQTAKRDQFQEINTKRNSPSKAGTLVFRSTVLLSVYRERDCHRDQNLFTAHAPKDLPAKYKTEKQLLFPLIEFGDLLRVY